MSKEAESKRAEQELAKLRKLPENRQCANCLAPGAPLLTAVIMPFRIFVCSNCKSAHQSFSHRAKSTQMSLWTMEEVRSLEDRNGGGNRAAQDRWLRYVKDRDRPHEGDSEHVYKDFVRRAYNEERWAAQGDDRGESRDSRRQNTRQEDSRDKEEGDRRRDRGPARTGKERQGEDTFDPDASGPRASSLAGPPGPASRARGKLGRGPVEEIDLFDTDAASTVPRPGAAAADLFDPDRQPSRGCGSAAPAAEMGFNPDMPSAAFNSSPPAATSAPFDAFSATPAATNAGSGLFGVSFDPLGPQPVQAAPQPSGGMDLFTDFQSGPQQASAPVQQPSSFPNNAMSQPPPLQASVGASAPQMGMGMASMMQTPMACPAAGGLAPCNAAANSQGGWMQPGFPASAGSWAGGGGFPPATGGLMGPAQAQFQQQQGLQQQAQFQQQQQCMPQQQQSMPCNWASSGTPWPAQQCPQGLQYMQQPQQQQQQFQPQQQLQQQQQQQPVRLEDLKQNLHQLYAAA